MRNLVLLFSLLANSALLLSLGCTTKPAQESPPKSAEATVEPAEKPAAEQAPGSAVAQLEAPETAADKALEKAAEAVADKADAEAAGKAGDKVGDKGPAVAAHATAEGPEKDPGATPGVPAGGNGFTNADMAGDWLGILETSRLKLRIALHVRLQPDGSLKATLDSLDQGANGIPVDAVTLDRNKFRVESKLVHSVFAGEMKDKDTLEGAWEQGGANLPLTMHRTANIEQPKRPQEPKPPFPYTEEEVVVPGLDEGVQLAGTLTLPKDASKVPAVLLITGSGLQDRNETVMGHRPFLVLADALTRAGIAVARFDDRGFGASRGDAVRATTADFSRDAEAAFAYLKGRPEVDPARVGVLGHSEGAIIAGMLAARLPDVAFVVLLAGPGVNGADIVVKQVELNAKATGLPPEEVAKLVEVQKEVFKRLKAPNTGNLKQELYDLMYERAVPAELKAAATPEQKKALQATQETLKMQIEGVLSPWFQFFLTYEPTSDLAKVKVPLLAMTGEKDTQVDAEPNLAAISAALAKAGNTRATVKKLPGLNHLFQTAGTGGVDEYASIEETFAPGALQMLTQWILEVTAAASPAR